MGVESAKKKHGGVTPHYAKKRGWDLGQNPEKVRRKVKENNRWKQKKLGKRR